MDLVQSLNDKLKLELIEEMSNSEIEEIFHNEIEFFFGRDLRSKETFKKTYHLLSLQLHSDRQNSEPFKLALKSKNLADLPQQVLTTIKSEIEMANDDPQSTANDDPPTWSYYPLAFAENKITKLCLLINESIDISSNDELSEDGRALYYQRVKEAFPELYYYENYPVFLHDQIYTLYACINIALFLPFCAYLGISVLKGIFDSFIMLPFLQVATQSQYLHSCAEILTMKEKIKQMFEIDLLKIDLKDFERPDIIYLYNKLMLKTESFQIDFLEELSLNSDDEKRRLSVFKCCYVMEISKLGKKCPFFEDIKNEMAQFENERPNVRHSNLQILISDLLDHCPELIEKLYTKIRDLEDEQFRLACITNFSCLSILDKVRSTANGMSGMITDVNLPVFERICRTLVFMMSSPLILVSLSIELISKIFLDSLMATKLLSAELINAPLKAYSFFAVKTTENGYNQSNDYSCNSQKL